MTCQANSSVTPNLLAVKSKEEIATWLKVFPWTWYYTQTFEDKSSFKRYYPRVFNPPGSRKLKDALAALPPSRSYSGRVRHRRLDNHSKFSASQPMAWRRWKRVLTYLRKRYGRGVGYFVAIEEQLRGAAHYHTLLLGVPSEMRYAQHTRYLKPRYGFCHFDRYTDVQALRDYISKYVVKDEGNLARWEMWVPKHLVKYLDFTPKKGLTDVNSTCIIE